MDSSQRNTLITRYKDGYRVVAQALEGISDRELDFNPAPNKWSPRQIVHHLADSEMTSAIRLRQLIAQDRPEIKAYDEKEFAKRLFYDRPYEASLEAFRWARNATAPILDRMGEHEWSRVGTHTESGAYSAERWLEIYADHAHNHADQIRRAREAAKNQ